MFRGKNLSLSVYGTSHGPSVGCLLSGVPPGIEINMQTLESAMRLRKTGGKYASKRSEEDNVEFLSGVNNNITTSEPILIQIQNQDAKRTDYSFLPKQPRPGHQDMVMNIALQARESGPSLSGSEGKVSIRQPRQRCAHAHCGTHTLASTQALTPLVHKRRSWPTCSRFSVLFYRCFPRGPR